jgi:DNA-binding winged helix-turn-helix (wHTH) protein
MVARDEVRQRLWPGSTFVGFDNRLGVAVRKLREALRDQADASRFAETIHRRGYRLIALGATFSAMLGERLPKLSSKRLTNHGRRRVVADGAAKKPPAQGRWLNTQE